MSTHSVHFPPAPETEEKRSSTRLAGETQRENVGALEWLSAAVRDVDLARGMIRGLLRSANRHGDLQVALSAARRLQTALESLIEGEEN